MTLRMFRWIIILVVMPVFFSCTGKDQGSTVKNPAFRAISVTVLVIRPQSVDHKIISTGTLMAGEEIDLRSEIPGRIITIYFQEDSRIARGELLVKIDDQELQAQLKKLSVEQKEATDDVYRKEKLLELKALSQEEYDKAANQLAIVLADIDLIRSQLAKTELLAPFSGQIGLRNVSPGEYISSSTIIARLQQLDPIKIEFTIPEKYQRLVSKGTQIYFTVTGLTDTFTGTVYAIEPTVDPSTRNLTLRAVSPNPGNLLMPGSFARIEIVLEKLTDALMIPSEALIPTLEGEKVFLCRNGRAHAVVVQTGLRTEHEVQVLDGIHSNDSLITSGLLQLRKETRVIPTAMPSPPR